MSSETELEKELVEKGLTAARITPEDIEGLINTAQFYVFPNTLHTVCCLTLKNGFTVIGESACVHPDNFDVEIGRKIAMENAKNKIWMLEGYLLANKLHNRSGLQCSD